MTGVEAGVVATVALLGGLADYRHRRIPNALTIPAWAAGIAYAAGTGRIRPTLLGLTIALLIYLPAWYLGALGGGDVKLAAALAVWGSWPFTAAFLLAASLAGGALAIWELRDRWVPMAAAILSRGSVREAVRLIPEGRTVPYGVALSAGAILALLLQVGGGGWRL